MPEGTPSDNTDRLVLIRSSLRKADRELRFVRQLVAQELESKAAVIDSPERTHDDTHTRKD